MHRKGQEYAITAFSKLLAHNKKSIKLLMVGNLDREKYYVSKIKSMIDELKLQNRVMLLDFVEDIDKIFAISDIYLHTALRDPHPRALLEAMNNSLPTVGFDVDGVGETIVHNESGFLVDTGNIEQMTNYLKMLVNDLKLRKQFGKKGREIISKKFLAQNTAIKIKAIIDNLFDK